MTDAGIVYQNRYIVIRVLLLPGIYRIFYLNLAGDVKRQQLCLATCLLHKVLGTSCSISTGVVVYNDWHAKLDQSDANRLADTS